MKTVGIFERTNYQPVKTVFRKTSTQARVALPHIVLLQAGLL